MKPKRMILFLIVYAFCIHSLVLTAFADSSDKVNVEFNFGKYSTPDNSLQNLSFRGKFLTSEIDQLVQILSEHQMIPRPRISTIEESQLLTIDLSKVVAGKLRNNDKKQKIRELEYIIESQQKRLNALETKNNAELPGLQQRIKELTQKKVGVNAESFHRNANIQQVDSSFEKSNSDRVVRSVFIRDNSNLD